jgi:hypothetical protein
MFGSHNRQQNMQETAMVLLGREELDVWLGEPQDFILAVLRDIYEREEDVLLWLNSPLPDQRGQVAVDLLSAGRTADVEAILVDQWNER